MKPEEGVRVQLHPHRVYPCHTTVELMKNVMSLLCIIADGNIPAYESLMAQTSVINYSWS